MIMYLILVRLWLLRRTPDVEMESMVERTSVSDGKSEKSQRPEKSSEDPYGIPI